ncbi:MAG TPA: PilT/PilU family type 4a pilus ATPase [Candidatus Rifleibacterium sp.]|nr:PilT/PilU family type 4a pilus ATPase [Candidatus Rifleibacterium sp.]
MKIEATGEALRKILSGALKKCGLFGGLTDVCLNGVIDLAGGLQVYDDGELIIAGGSAPEFFLVIIEGEASVKVGEPPNLIEVARPGAGQMIGEMSVILNEAHTAAVYARGTLKALCFTSDVFYNKLLLIHEVDVALMRVLGEKLKQTSQYPSYQRGEKELPIPDMSLLKLLPIEFMQWHRLAPIRQKGNVLLIGYSESINPTLLNSIARLLPGMEIRPVCIDSEYFNRIMQSYAGEMIKLSISSNSGTRHIDDLLRRLVEVGGSDLHLSAGQKPRWRINGEILEIDGPGRLGPEEVIELLRPVARKDILDGFTRSSDGDFAYSMGNSCRFRINLLRDHNGVSAVFRHIPNAILSLEALNMPPILQKFCDQPKGLVLVTGPTGSGKSTTLAAMIDWINHRRKCHILTIEDPIEFVHQSHLALVNQREVGTHTENFARALRAGLREDPDVVLVGEMRDNETIAMALETANTGHLVFATLHTSTATSTIDRIVDNFPGEMQGQIRMSLADNLIGVVSQTLCRRIVGGRIPALEIMVMDYAMANLIRTAKTHMLPNSMLTAQANGNRLLNDDLARLVFNGLITPHEAMSKTRDKAELEKKLSSFRGGSTVSHDQRIIANLRK